MQGQNKNLMIGIFVIVALAITTYIILFLNPKVGDEGQVVYVRFSNIDKIGVGTRVLFAGHHVGEVSNIREVENARDPAYVRDGKVYIYELVLTVDSGVEVYTTDQISIRTSGLLGEKSIEITPSPTPKGKPLIRVRNQVLYSEPSGTVEEAISEISTLAQAAQKAIEKIDQGLETLHEEKFFDSLGSIAKNISEITTELNQPGEWENFTKNLNATVKDLSEVTVTMNKGEGTIGRLVKNDDLYLRLTSVMSKAETVMDDINHYGLLFNNNKNWQRLRARKMNLMAKLQTPEEFQNFFNDEINQISTSLSRVNMVLNESQCPSCIPVVCCPEFQRVFADLLRRVEGLEDNLKLYDQQLVETLENKCVISQPCQ